jgi:hydrogenase/urease accessory protein HupE
LFVLFLVLVISLSAISHAHESRPIYVEVEETKPETFSFTIKTPKTIPDFNIPSIVVPTNCEPIEAAKLLAQRDSYLREASFKCSGGLSGEKIELSFPAIIPSVQTLIRVQSFSGITHSKLLDPGEITWEIPAKENKSQVAKDYTLLGISHILEGYDHLLFLACLILIAGTGRKILITVTGFTIAHSIALVLSTLNLVTVPIAPVEAVIALSIVFLATEIAKEPRDTLTYRYPALVSVCFGLLHGFGFAAVLKEIGLPQTELATSLLFFNIGVEIGQIIFILVVIALYKILITLTKSSNDILGKLEVPAAYVVGSQAAFWMIERIYSFWY